MPKHAAAVGSGVKVIQRVPLIHATNESPFNPDVEILIRTKTITTVTLPSLVAEHSLASIEIIGSASVIQVEILLLAIKELCTGVSIREDIREKY